MRKRFWATTAVGRRLVVMRDIVTVATEGGLRMLAQQQSVSIDSLAALVQLVNSRVMLVMRHPVSFGDQVKQWQLAMAIARCRIPLYLRFGGNRRTEFRAGPWRQLMPDSARLLVFAIRRPNSFDPRGMLFHFPGGLGDPPCESVRLTGVDKTAFRMIGPEIELLLPRVQHRGTCLEMLH